MTTPSTSNFTLKRELLIKFMKMFGIGAKDVRVIKGVNVEKKRV